MDLPCRLAPPAYLSALPLLVMALVVTVLAAVAVPSGPVEMRAANDMGGGSTSGSVANVRPAAGGPPGIAGFADQTAAYYPPYTPPCQTPVNDTVGWVVENLTAKAWGGTPPYTFWWEFGDGSPNGTGAEVTHRYSDSDGFIVLANVTVRDAAGGENASQLRVIVQPPIASPLIVQPWTDDYICVGTTQVTYGALFALGFVGFWVAVAVVMVAWRKRHPRPPRPGARYVLVPVVVAPPPPPPPEPPR